MRIEWIPWPELCLIYRALFPQELGLDREPLLHFGMSRNQICQLQCWPTFVHLNLNPGRYQIWSNQSPPGLLFLGWVCSKLQRGLVNLMREPNLHLELNSSLPKRYQRSWSSFTPLIIQTLHFLKIIQIFNYNLRHFWWMTIVFFSSLKAFE